MISTRVRRQIQNRSASVSFLYKSIDKDICNERLSSLTLKPAFFFQRASETPMFNFMTLTETHVVFHKQ